MPDEPWVVVPAILAYAVAVTWAAERLVALHHGHGGFRRRTLPAERGADAVWAVVVLAAGFVAARYLERLSAPAAMAGYAVLALAGLLLSWVRSRLYRRVLDARQTRRAGGDPGCESGGTLPGESRHP